MATILDSSVANLSAVGYLRTCAVLDLKKIEGEILKNNFSLVGEVEALLQFLACAFACMNCKCAYTCVMA